MASIVERGPFQFQATVRRKGFPVQIKTFESRAEAAAWAYEQEALYLRGTLPGSLGAPTLAEAIDRYAKEETPKKKGAEQEAYKLKILRRAEFAGLSLRDITPGHVSAWVTARLAEVKSGTVARDLSVLSKIFNHARRGWGLSGLPNPVSEIVKPRPGKPRKRRISEDEIEALCAASDSPYLPAALRLAVETAMRRGEIVSLRWRHIDLDAQTAYLPDTKNGDDRTVPLSLAAVALLRALPRDSDDDRVFPLRADALTRALTRARDRAGLDIRFHDTRREGTTRIARKLGDSLATAAVTGHRDWRTLKQYFQPDPADLARRLG